MKTAWWLINSAFTLVVLACQTTAPSPKVYRNEIMGLEGMANSFVKSEWGEPDESAKKDKKETVKYKDVLIQDEDLMTGTIVDRICVVKLELDDEKLVTDWEYENCELKNIAGNDGDDQVGDAKKDDIEKVNPAATELSVKTDEIDSDDKKIYNSESDLPQNDEQTAPLSNGRKLEMIPLVE